MPHALPPLNALRAFDAVARRHSVTQAADELHVTHGAVSRQLKTLETTLGVALFVKEGRGLKLTDAGRCLREVTDEAFGRLREVCNRLQRQTAEAPLVLGCPGSLLARWFIPRLERLNQQLPELRLQLSACEEPRRPGVDAMLWFAEPPWPADMQVFELAVERIGPVLSPLHPRCAALRQQPVSALLNEALLHTTSRPQAWPRWFASQHLALSQLRLGQGFEHLYYLLEAALTGLGVAIAPQQVVADDLASGRLLAPWGFVETPAQLVLWVPQHPVNPRAARLAVWLQQEVESSARA